MRIQLLLIIIPFLIQAQSRQKTEQWINELNNSQFRIDPSHKATFSFESKSALKLIKKGKRNGSLIMESLLDSARCIMAQLILSNIYYGKACFAGPTAVFENGTHIQKYFLGEEKGEGMIISSVRHGNEVTPSVSIQERQRIHTYWKHRIKQ